MNIREYLDKVDKVIENGPYKDTAESLAAYPYPQWFEDAKFGLFMHWGVYSVPAFFNEWYPRLMYYRGNPVYWQHRLKYGKNFNYKDFIPRFNAENSMRTNGFASSKTTRCNSSCLWASITTDLRCTAAN